MASERQNNLSSQGRPLKPALASTRTAKTPITPRLAANASATTSTPSTRPAAPRLAAAPSAPFPSKSHPPSLQPSLIEDVATPVKTASLSDNITPRSSSRKSRVDSTNTTPTTAPDDTPSSKRPKLLSPAQSEPIAQRPSLDDPRPHLGPPKPKSIVNGRERDTATVLRASAPRSPAYLAAPSSHGPPRITKDTSPMFFRADQVTKPQAESQPRTLNKKKSSTFFYANGHEDRKRKPASSATSSVSRNASPDPSVRSDTRSPHLPVPHSSNDTTPTLPLLSPPLASLSSISPYFASKLANAPSFPSPSPPKENIHLSYRKGVSQIIGRTASPLPERSPLPVPGQTQRKTSLGTTLGKPATRSGRAKSSSLSSIDVGSPEPPRGQQSQLHTPSVAAKPPVPSNRPAHPLPPSPYFPPPNRLTDSPTLLPTTEDPLQSPVKQLPDLAAEARRERKVLDLEISNSSLLAINKSLEREIRKQKAELKRFRRLSRAGQFDVTAIDRVAANHMTTLDEETDELPDFDGDAGRPSSPFESEPADDFSEEDDVDSANSSAHPLSPGAQAEEDAKHRVDDEERLRLDLNKHRELLLDTQRMNKSLQRCLTWTEDLIHQGKKALEYQVPSDVKLGGRILTDDDEIDDDEVHNEPSAAGGAGLGADMPQTDDELSLQDGTELEDGMPGVDDLVAEAMQGYLNARQGQAPKRSNRHSGSATGSGSEKDSGVDFTIPHAIEFGKATPLQNRLLMSKGNPGNNHSKRIPGEHKSKTGEIT